MEGFTEALRVEVKPFGINVVNINPGDYHTSATQNRKIVTQSTDIYRNKFDRVLSLYEKDELNGGDPIQVAKLIAKLIKKEGNYKVRYITANPSQKVATYLKRFISSRLFERILISLYK